MAVRCSAVANESYKIRLSSLNSWFFNLKPEVCCHSVLGYLLHDQTVTVEISESAWNFLGTWVN
jgi:hypothetical protein